MESNVLFTRLLDQRDIHVLTEEKILVLPIHAGESRVELRRDLRIG